MKNSYNNAPRSSSSGFLFKALGFIFAVILFIGMLDKAGINISVEEGEAMSGEIARASVAESDTRPADVRSNRIVIEADEPEVKPARTYASPESYDVSSASRRPTRELSRNVNLENWISNFSDLAVEQALDRGIPAGVALAVGLSRISEGVRIDNWNDFMEEVIDPLAAAKFQASREEIRSYFKYSANSERWADGLGLNGDFSTNSLKALLKKYALRDFDYEVRNRLAKAPEVERRAREVAEEVTFDIKEERWERREMEKSSRPKTRNMEKEQIWEAEYDEMVGRELAKEIAKKKLKDNPYISEEDMARLVRETNEETSDVLKHKLAFPGRKINGKHPQADKLRDITRPENSQAREELYQQKLKERKASRKKERS